MTRFAVPRLLLATILAAGGSGIGGAAAAAHAAPADRFQAGETLALGGLASTATSFTSLALVNWAPVPARCSLAFTGADGDRLGPALHLTLEPMGSTNFLDALEGRQAEQAQLKVSCDQDFSAYSLVADRRTGALAPSAPAELSSAVSEDVVADAPPCPAGASCFDAVGLVHVPEPPSGIAVGRVAFPAPAITLKRLVLSLDVKVDQWYPIEPDGKHLIYWFVIDRNFDMPGLLYFRGPSKSEAFARHGIHLTHPEKIKVIKKWTAAVGVTYHVVNDYDMAKKRFTVTISDAATGAVQVVLQGKPNVAAFTVKRNARFIVDMGFPPDLVPTEVPSYDWQYSNVHIEAYKK
jgi:hypothetical protein